MKKILKSLCTIRTTLTPLWMIIVFFTSIYLRHSYGNFALSIPFFIIFYNFYKIYTNGENKTEIKKIILLSLVSFALSLVLGMVLTNSDVNQKNIVLDLFYGLRLTLVFIIIINYYKFYSNPSPKKQFYILIIISIIAISILVFLLISLNKDEFTLFTFIINKKEIKDIALFICISCLSEASLVFLE